MTLAKEVEKERDAPKAREATYILLDLVGVVLRCHVMLHYSFLPDGRGVPIPYPRPAGVVQLCVPKTTSMCEDVCEEACVRMCVRYVCEGVCEDMWGCVMCEDVCVRRQVRNATNYLASQLVMWSSFDTLLGHHHVTSHPGFKEAEGCWCQLLRETVCHCSL